MPGPLAYFLTWTTYGTWLHGDDRRSVDGMHNHYGGALARQNSHRLSKNASRLSDHPLVLTHEAREAVDRAIRSHCEHRDWNLLAVNVRSNHVYVVVAAGEIPPELAMKSLKAWASRALMAYPDFAGRRSFWTRHGSTKYLWDDRSVHDACRYVRDAQDGLRFEKSDAFAPRSSERGSAKG
jgi:REP element-mobilizing transposase RayT